MSARPLTTVLRKFQERYPTVQMRLFEVAVQMVRDRIADIGIAFMMHEQEDLLIEPFIMLERMMVVASDHPLAQLQGLIAGDALRDHVQLVLTDRDSSRASRDYSVFSARTWQVGDIETKAYVLEQGLGFGTLPNQLAEVGISAGGLTKLDIEGAEDIGRPFQASLVRRMDQPIGPSARWMMEELRRLKATSVTHP